MFLQSCLNLIPFYLKVCMIQAVRSLTERMLGSSLPIADWITCIFCNLCGPGGLYMLIEHKHIVALGAKRKQCLFNVGDLNGWELNKYHKRWNVNHLFHTHLVCLIMQGVTTEIVLTGWWPSFTLPRRFFYNRI